MLELLVHRIYVCIIFCICVNFFNGVVNVFNRD